MSTVTKTLGATIVAALNTIGTGATTISKTVDAAAGGIDMLDSFVKQAKINQANSQKIESARAISELISDAALADVKRNKKIMTELTTPAEQAAFNKACANYEALFSQPETQA